MRYVSRDGFDREEEEEEEEVRWRGDVIRLDDGSGWCDLYATLWRRCGRYTAAVFDLTSFGKVCEVAVRVVVAGEEEEEAEEEEEEEVGCYVGPPNPASELEGDGRDLLGLSLPAGRVDSFLSSYDDLQEKVLAFTYEIIG